MIVPSLAKRFLALGASALIAISGFACGRKGDPVPRPRALPGACTVRMVSLRRLAVTLPARDASGAGLDGIERVRVYYLPLGAAQPSASEVAAKGEVVLERSRPDLPGPGESFELDLSGSRRGRGWMVVVAVRVGEVLGAPGTVQPWLDPEL